MGVTFVEGQVSSNGESQAVRFLVDSGASYTLLPQEVWRALGLKATRRMSFSLADGTSVERDISECRLALPHGEAHTPVVLGEAGDEALLGVATLEILGLVLNPFNRTLQPMRLMLR